MGWGCVGGDCLSAVFLQLCTLALSSFCNAKKSCCSMYRLEILDRYRARLGGVRPNHGAAGQGVHPLNLSI